MTGSAIQFSFDQALQHHQAGRFQEAEQLYRQVLTLSPMHIDALVLLGIVCTLTGRPDEAIELIQRAVPLRPEDARIYNTLGNALRAGGDPIGALREFDRAIQLKADFPEAHLNRGNLLNDLRRYDEAIMSANKAIALRPNYAEAFTNLGLALAGNQQVDEAIAAYRRAIALNPNLPETHSNLGNALRDKKQLDEAIAAFERAISLNPKLPELHFNLAVVLSDRGRLAEAIAANRKAIELRPNYAQAYNNLGDNLQENGQIDEAIAAFRQALALKPDYAEALYNLANALADKREYDSATATFRHAMAVERSATGLTNFANLLKDTGHLDESIALLRESMALDPDYVNAHSNLILLMNYHPACDSHAIADELRRWNQQHVQPLRKSIQPHTNDRNPDRRLRIGYVSPDFQNHVVGRNMVPLFEHHDHKQFEIVCYANVMHADQMTNALKSRTDKWTNIVGRSEDELAAQIRADCIDVLVDLALHTGKNRLLVFARKPAPVQFTFAGYPGSTGLETIDYRLSDPYLDPPGTDESIYSEQTIRLPHSFWCYDPIDGKHISVNPLPADSNGIITFGCLCNFCKVNREVLALWARVMRQIENSRLILRTAEGAHRQETLNELANEGIDPARVEFVPSQSHRKYLELFHRIDIGLDAFPYNGHTTSLDSFWMGVPVVTLVGETIVGRAGLCQLSNLGLPELAGKTAEQFVQIAVDLAKDLPRLRELRASLRSFMQNSPLTDGLKFARGIEAAYRKGWQAWCASTTASR